MYGTRYPAMKYVTVAFLGAIGGGLLVAIATRAIPKMMSGMMQNMMGQMKESGVTPAEMCQKMMQGFGEAQPEKTPNE